MSQNEQQIVKDLLAQFYDKRANNAPPLGINLLEISKAQNGGYPLTLYHSIHKPVIVDNLQQEQAIAQRGYVRNYIRHNYPRTLYRRNMATVKQRIGESKDYEDIPKFPDFVETAVANDADHEKGLKGARVPALCSAWCVDCAHLPEMEDGPAEDKDAVIARLRGQLEGLQSGGEQLPVPRGAMSAAEKRKATIAAKQAAAERDED